MLALAVLVLPAAIRPRPAARLTAPVDSLGHGLVWRSIGPFRGGRIAAVSGAVGQPGVFYAGLPAGGVWKTTSAGVTWFPVFDSVKTVSSVGAIEVAPSDADVIYAGTGDMITGGAINEGDGVYKSTDAGRTWTHMGLDSTKQIPSIIVDPRDPDLVMVAAQGDIHVPTEARGVFRSADGGRSWRRTLFVDEETGIQKLARASDVPDVVFATTVRHYNAPARPGAPRSGTSAPQAPTGTALYKSTDNGVTWREITGGGLPRLAGRTSVAVAMHTNAQRVFLIGNFGLYRSDDGGTNWRQMDSTDRRVGNGQGGYNCGVYVDPRNPDVVYTINTASYKSTDGGNTFTGFKGAPGGDDPQQMWIDPTNGQRIFLGLDQGAAITLDGGQTWTPWYNQPMEQVYHISTDNSFPYWIYATQQDAGAVRTRSRGNLGEITPLDWNPVPGWEWGSITPDPLHPDTVYASGSGIVKISYPTEQWINVSPSADPAARLRTAFSQPIVFTPWNPHQLLAGFQYLMSTTDGGVHWTRISPDLSLAPRQPSADTATADGRPSAAPNGAIETISPSSAAAGTIWVGTNNGRIQLTRDGGKSWTDVSIPDLPNPARANVTMVDASHTDPATAYAAVEYHNVGDYAPYLYRTHDYGKTWTEIVRGLPTDQPSGSFARVIRADPVRNGLLFAGTESGVYVSFDDGDAWQPLMFNLPNTSYRDLQIKGNDLIAGTYGRGIWILDDYAVLRQITPASLASTHLYTPDATVRVRRNVNADTPFPPEVPHALNAPEGAIIYYSLAHEPSGDFTLDVFDARGRPVRHLSSAPISPVAEAAEPPEPNFWLAEARPLPAHAGLNRANWDLRYDAPPAFSHSFEINANPGLTPASPEGPLALPGRYTLVLRVDGKSYTAPLTVARDPRNSTSMAALEAQNALLMNIDEGLHTSWDAYEAADALRDAAEQAAANGPSDVRDAEETFVARIDSVAGSTGRRRGGAGGGGFRQGGGAPPATFMSVNAALVRQLEAQDDGDMAPTEPTLAAYAATCRDLASALTRWSSVVGADLSAFNQVLGAHGGKPIAAPSAAPTAPGC
jgi:photosystem II stability/assembly factor-like uncharacterized protein